MIEAVGLTKDYGPVRALAGVSFRVRGGQVAAFLGPNGAGKTTCMRILAGYLPPTRGTARLAGHDVLREPRAARRALGYLPENVPLYRDMRVVEYLDFRARLKGLDRRARRRRVAAVLATCGLGPVAARLVGRLSKGYRQRVGLADALVADPPVLILDEPTVGLDPNQVVEVRRLIQELGRERTVLLSTHILGEAEVVSRWIVILHRGRLLAQDTPEGLRRRVGLRLPVRVEVRGVGASQAAALLGEVTGVAAVAREGSRDGWHRFALTPAPQADPRTAVARAVAARGLELRELHREEPTLEQVFRILTGEEGGAA